ncbi:hypothetical protein CDAR_228551 [Caerostris darwini]|uniref:Uncharacterized protein n=1 Tax=Caerostris darwini TaxID=1538125 RepID=A0AAV4N4P4_9ARAC|nr:hypothetical protein CDAR_228551 [Caerostris darwini]
MQTSEIFFTAFEADGKPSQFLRIPFEVTIGVVSFQSTIDYISRRSQKVHYRKQNDRTGSWKTSILIEFICSTNHIISEVGCGNVCPLLSLDTQILGKNTPISKSRLPLSKESVNAFESLKVAALDASLC